MNQHVEDLWLDADEGAVSMQLTPVTVDFAVSEYESYAGLQEPPDFLRQTSSVRSGQESTSRGIMAAMASHPQPSRRDLLKGRRMWRRCRRDDERAFGDADMKSKVFVLVHPAWHGAWFWKSRAAPAAETHLVFTPTLTGLGERSHLARAEVGLDVHVTDVVNVLRSTRICATSSSSGTVLRGR